MAYATPSDLARLGVAAAALSDVPVPDQEAALDAASRLADSYLARRYRLPLVSWGDDLKRAVALIAAYDLIAVRGFAPEGADEHLRLRYEDAIRWLEQVAKGEVEAQVEEAAGTEEKGAPVFVGPPPRGW